MPLKNRILKVTFQMPSGPVVLDQSIFLAINIEKFVLSLQNRATIDVIGLTSSLRSFLLSNFSAFRIRQVQTGQAPQIYIPVQIVAGWQSSDGSTVSSVIFKGEVAECTPFGTNPDQGVRIQAYTHQIDRTAFQSEQLSETMTFSNLVAWVGRQLGVTDVICRTSYDGEIIKNPAAGVITRGALPAYLQSLFYPAVSVWIDDDTLIVLDAASPRSVDGNPVTLSTPIGMPMPTQYGVQVTTLLDTSILLGDPVVIKSRLNKTLDGQTMVVNGLTYDLASREPEFYVTVNASPPAAAPTQVRQ